MICLFMFSKQKYNLVFSQKVALYFVKQLFLAYTKGFSHKLEKWFLIMLQVLICFKRHIGLFSENPQYLYCSQLLYDRCHRLNPWLADLQLESGLVERCILRGSHIVNPCSSFLAHATTSLPRFFAFQGFQTIWIIQDEDRLF